MDQPKATRKAPTDANGSHGSKGGNVMGGADLRDALLELHVYTTRLSGRVDAIIKGEKFFDEDPIAGLLGVAGADGQRVMDALRSALDRGGAAWLDARTAPGPDGFARSVGLREAIDSLSHCTAALCLSTLNADPRSAIGDGLREKFRQLEGIFKHLSNMVRIAVESGANASGEPASRGDGGTAAITDAHERILRCLHKRAPRCCQIADIVSAPEAKTRNRETVGRLLSELEGMGLVHRPNGKRKGRALTAAGEDLLSRLTT